MELPTAQEAQQKIVDNLNESGQKQFDELTLKINEAIMSGSDFLVTNIGSSYLHSGVKIKLKRMGYDLRVNHFSNWVISWG